jgi:hypothetical protein
MEGEVGAYLPPMPHEIFEALDPGDIAIGAIEVVALLKGAVEAAEESSTSNPLEAMVAEADAESRLQEFREAIKAFVVGWGKAVDKMDDSRWMRPMVRNADAAQRNAQAQPPPLLQGHLTLTLVVGVPRRGGALSAHDAPLRPLCGGTHGRVQQCSFLFVSRRRVCTRLALGGASCCHGRRRGERQEGGEFRGGLHGWGGEGSEGERCS